jgi:competence protein ComEC
MAVESLRASSGPVRPASGLVLLTVNGAPPSGLLPGDRFLARCILSPVHSYGIPGAFDYRRFLGNRGIWLTGWVSSSSLLHRFNDLPPPSLLMRLRYGPERLRYRIGRFLERELPPRIAGLYKAILIGDRSGVDSSTIERFKDTGTIHLLAISGLHMGLLAMLLMGVLSWLLKRSTRLLLSISVWKVTALLIILPLVGYALIAGFQIPVARALIITLVFLFAIITDRQGSLPSAIALAAMLLLIWRPAQLFDVSFQLSFAAVIAIALALPHLRPLFYPGSDSRAAIRIGKRILATLAVSLAAMIGTLPLLLYHFNRFSPLGPFATLAVEPLLCLWSLTMGLLACLLLPFSAGMAGLLLKAGSMGIAAADRLVALFAALPLSSLWLPTPSLPELLALFLLPIALLYRQRFPAARPMAGFSLLLLILIPVFHTAARHLGRSTRITVLDVGQGSSVLLELPEGRTALIDGGGYRSEQFDPGEQLIAPYLWRRGINRLDSLVISHPHADHYNGLSFVLEHFHPRVIWVNGRPGIEADYRHLLAQAAALGITVRVPAAGESLEAEENFRLRNLADFHLKDSRGNPNGDSLVLRLDSGKISFLFPGDIDREMEGRLVAAGKKLDADVLLAAHHGSSGSNGPRLLAAVSPRYLAVSVGPFGPMYAAAERRLPAWRRQGITPLTTATCGSIVFTTDGRALEASSFNSCPGIDPGDRR